MKNDIKVAIIGAGFYGLMLANFLAKKYKVTIFEQENIVMSKASSLCQMRIHTGMMYPRNIKTAINCLKTFEPFMLKFKHCIYDEFKSIYAVAKDSAIDSESFYKVQKELGLPIKKIPNEYFANIDGVFECNEFTFDISEITKTLLDQCYNKNIDIKFNTKINNLEELDEYEKVFLCNYANINDILCNSSLKPIESLKIINSEKIFYTDNIGDIAMTVVDGNYFSTMCLPKKYNGLKTLTGADLTNNCNIINGKYQSNYEKVFDRVKYYIPDIKLKYINSQFGKKAIIDGHSRNCFIRKEPYHKDVFSILGGKITNVFCLFDELKKLN